MHVTVRDLIEALREFDPNAEVLTSGYEGGYQSPRIRTDRVVYDPIDFEGTHRGLFEDEHEPGEFVAVIIGR